MSHVLPNISRGQFFEPIFTSKKFDLYTSIYGSDETKVADLHFLVSVVELTPFLSISVCWFWFRLWQTRKRSPKEMGLLV